MGTADQENKTQFTNPVRGVEGEQLFRMILAGFVHV